MSSACLLIAHGSRENESNLSFLKLADRFQEKNPETIVVGSFLELAAPSIAEGIAECARRGAERITIVPLMFFPGRHVTKDIPRLVEEAARDLHIPIAYAGALADHPGLLGLLEDKYRWVQKENP